MTQPEVERDLYTLLLDLAERLTNEDDARLVRVAAREISRLTPDIQPGRKTNPAPPTGSVRFGTYEILPPYDPNES